MTEPLPISSAGTFADFKKVFMATEIRNLTAVSLQTREHTFGVILFPHAERRAFGSSGPHLMVGLASAARAYARELFDHPRRSPPHPGI
jgi:hypothetical protein